MHKYRELLSCLFRSVVNCFVLLQSKRNQNLPEQICSTCISDLDASYRFKMNCESSDAILQTYIPKTESEVFSEASENDDEMISESEAEIPVDESDLYNYQSQMYDENGEMIGDEDNLENALDVSSSKKLKWWFKLLILIVFFNILGWADEVKFIIDGNN